MLFSFVFQILSLLYGVYLGRKVLEKNLSLSFDESVKDSNIFTFISLISLLIIFFGVFTLQFDSFCLQLPLFYQKYSMYITWLSIILYLAFVSGFFLYLTFRVRKERFQIYLFALFLMNVLLFINHYQKNSYQGEASSVQSVSSFVKQSSNYSCTSASISTVAKYLDINTSERAVARLSRLTKLGANAGQVRFALNALGIEYHTLLGEMNSPDALKEPAILYVDNLVAGYEGHAIVYLGKNHYGYQIWDPVGFKIYLSKKELKEIWHGHGEECFVLH